jgi:hypothetical protein
MPISKAVTATKKSLKRPRMGRKRAKVERKPRTPSEMVCVRIDQLAGDRQSKELAVRSGHTAQAWDNWRRWDRCPDLDDWPAIAKALGLGDWRDLVPPR